MTLAGGRIITSS